MNRRDYFRLEQTRLDARVSGVDRGEPFHCTMHVVDLSASGAMLLSF
jgi:hypothetical protein